jgi:hypothetical protein
MFTSSSHIKFRSQVEIKAASSKTAIECDVSKCFHCDALMSNRNICCLVDLGYVD